MKNLKIFKGFRHKLWLKVISYTPSDFHRRIPYNSEIYHRHKIAIANSRSIWKLAMKLNLGCWIQICGQKLRIKKFWKPSRGVSSLKSILSFTKSLPKALASYFSPLIASVSNLAPVGSTGVNGQVATKQGKTTRKKSQLSYINPAILRPQHLWTAM